MKTAIRATEKLHEMGQSLWLDNITRGLLTSGTLHRYIQEFSVTGLTSNPTIFDHAIKNSHDYDDAIRQKVKEGKSGEALFFELGLEDLGQAADLFRPIHDETERCGRLGVAGGLATAGPRHGRDPRRGQGPPCPRGTPQSLHQDTGYPGGPPRHRGSHLRRRAGQRDLAVLPRAIRGRRRGVSARHRAADCRRAANRDVSSVASMFISRWDVAVTGKVPENLRNQLGIAIAKRTYEAYCSLIDSPRYQRIRNAGARPQRLLWASTGTKDPSASDLLYIEALAAPFTVNTMPEGTLNALAEHGEISRILPAHGGDCEEVLTRFAKAGIDIDALATQLQDEGARSFVKSWKELMACIASKSEALK